MFGAVATVDDHVLRDERLIGTDERHVGIPLGMASGAGNRRRAIGLSGSARRTGEDHDTSQYAQVSHIHHTTSTPAHGRHAAVFLVIDEGNSAGTIEGSEGVSANQCDIARI